MTIERRHAMAKKKSNASQDARAKAGSKTAKPSAKAEPRTIYQLKITLQGVQPPVWRRVQTGDCTLADLHTIIQISMGWEDAHLHLFRIGSTSYGAPEQWESDFDDDLETKDEGRVKLSQLVKQGVKKFTYEYDMGDSWNHVIQLEKSPPVESGVRYPRCIDGGRACPPEDCGGSYGYCELVEAIQDPKHEQHAELLEWIGDDFDPEEFDADKVSKELRAYV
jgi:hypothetical protein